MLGACVVQLELCYLHTQRLTAAVEAAAVDMSQHADQVPVRAEGSGTQYDGRVWYELISSLRTVNGVAVEDMETPLDKSHLKKGKRVTLEFDGNFLGSN